MEFRDLDAVVIDLLRTKELQRLRRVRQMGLGHLVFPGAEHSRLVHVLGAAHLATRFGRQLAEDSRNALTAQLRPDAESIRDLAVAALCHDIGHGPLSHAWEREVIGGSDYDLSAWRAALRLDETRTDAVSKPAWHELVGQAILAWEDGELHQILEHYSEGFSDRIIQLLQGKYFLPYFPMLLDSDVDMDRADFLLRDSHSCGVGYGRYDLNWLISTLKVGFTESGSLVAGFDRSKGPRIVEQFLMARRAMYDTVYHHKTVRSVEGMVGVFLNRLKQLPEDELHNLEDIGVTFAPMIQALAGMPLPLDQLLMLDDFGLWTFIEYIARLDPDAFDSTACDLAKRISTRDLFKAVPVTNQEATKYFLTDGDPMARLVEAVSKVAPNNPECYVFKDVAAVQVLSTPPKSGFLIDNDRLATPITYCEEMSGIEHGGDQTVRIFTVRGALESVTQIVRSAA